MTYLTLSNLKTEDSAVYYCVRDINWFKEAEKIYRNLMFNLPGCSGQSMESIPPSPVMKKPGETLSLSCRGSGFTFTCCTMSWIRQAAGKELEWMGYRYDATSYGYTSSLQGGIEITRDNSNSMTYLTLSNLKTEDSAVYYCAKHTVVERSREALQKLNV
ncbi:hypothetical protein Q5P01_017503 [Channa striata]|uniref:Ig-like domain-containing protein n=1 Tax=Channa striata TaxID=64152 RepID=A0AA88SBN0_CHASR|nr:hypothetical protein Q5P01_017503 [Channa striata]